jgi:hypothetical protein
MNAIERRTASMPAARSRGGARYLDDQASCHTSPMPAQGLTHVKLTNFKAFKTFTLRLGGNDVYLVGPNNAGKSTLLAATRAAARMVRIAQRERADDRSRVDGVQQWGHAFASTRVDLKSENLRHEFSPEETRLYVGFGRDVRLTAVWPDASDNEDAFFFVKDNDVTLRRPTDVRQCLPRIAVVPVLSPLDPDERLLSDSQISSNLESQLASRHFRNQVAYMSRREGHDALERYFEYVHLWTPELELVPSRQAIGDIDIYYDEDGARHPREISWAGDGIQIWLQILLHLFRNQDADVVILDEPEVFLHPDLQRRLVHVLNAHSAQTVTATHSAEVLAEAPEESVVWVHRTKRQSIRKPSAEVATELSAALGTAFNVDLARAFKARAVVFVEGEDVVILRRLAATIGAVEIGNDRRITTIRLEGFERWDRLEGFKWLTDELLGKHIALHVLLDRDYRSPEEVSAIENALGNVGVGAHIWERHELENYLLEVPTISRLAAVDASVVAEFLQAAAEALRTEFRAGYLAAWTRTHPKHDAKRAVIETEAAIDELFGLPLSERLARLPGKELRAQLNQRLVANGSKPVSDRALAGDLRRNEIATELQSVLSRIEDSI